MMNKSKKNLNFFYRFVENESVNNTKVISVDIFGGMGCLFLIYELLITRSVARYIKGKPNIFLEADLTFLPTFIWTSILVMAPAIIFYYINAGAGIRSRSAFFSLSRFYGIFLTILLFSIRTNTPQNITNTIWPFFLVFAVIAIISIFHYGKIDQENRQARRKLANNLLKAYEKKLELANEVNEKFVDRLKSIHGNNYDYSSVLIQSVDVNSIGKPIVKNYNNSNVKCLIHDIEYAVDHRLIKNKGAGCPTCSNLFGLEDEDDPKLDEINKRTKEILNLEKESVSKLDSIALSIDTLLSDTSAIKKSSLNTDLKIEQIVKSVEDNYKIKNNSDYINKVKDWFNHWDELEEKSQTFMPTSEFLYQSIAKSSFEDYSPFILYYCRTLEYELLNKIFIRFHDHIENKYDDKSKLFHYNKENLNQRLISSIEKGPITVFKKNILYNKELYTLGLMRFILDLLPTNSDDNKKSKRYELLLVLQELNKFINEDIGSIESKVIKDIKLLIDEYRNPSAHTGIIKKEKAEKFYREFKLTMNSVMSSFKQKAP